MRRRGADAADSSLSLPEEAPPAFSEAAADERDYVAIEGLLRGIRLEGTYDIPSDEISTASGLEKATSGVNIMNPALKVPCCPFARRRLIGCGPSSSCSRSPSSAMLLER